MTRTLPSLYDIASWLSHNPNSIFIVPDDTQLRQCEAILSFVGVPHVIFPEWDCLPYSPISPSLSIQAKRVQALHAQNNTPIVTTTRAFIQKTLPASLFLTIEPGLSFMDVQEFCQVAGYTRVDIAHSTGEYAVRGSIIDIVGTVPLRCDFFGDTLESLRTFDVESQLSQEAICSSVLYSSREVILTDESIKNFRVKYREFFQRSSSPLYEAITKRRPYAGYEQWLPLFGNTISLSQLFPQRGLVCTNSFFKDADIFLHTVYQQYHQRREDGNVCAPEHLYMTRENIDKLGIKELENASQKKSVFWHIKENKYQAIQTQAQHIPLVYTKPTRGQYLSLISTLDEENIKYVEISSAEDVRENGLYVTHLPVEKGGVWHNTSYITDYEVFGKILALPVRSKTHHKDEKACEFYQGDYWVHRDYGVGQYSGLEQLSVDGTVHDCICLIYADGDKLWVPVENIGLLHFYAEKEVHTAVDKLGSVVFQKRRKKAKKNILEYAASLIALAAKRSVHKVDPLPIDTESYGKFCEGFGYVETEDQQRAITDIIGDLTSSIPMDRLLCGDVGYGKTEVAMRAAFLVAAAGKQVAILVPTTVLTKQHYASFSSRFSDFCVVHLSRLQTTQERQEAWQKIASGEANIIIATHALLSKKATFCDLGLLIIDEEQRFGVAQKDQLKKIYPDLHILSMTATPIPRTLQMSMVGIRDMSVIGTPPLYRLPVETQVLPYDKTIIRQAIMREYERGGQIFYVTPRIQGIESLHDKISRLVPEVRIAVIHGKLPPRALEKTMHDFMQRRYDMLMATDIIESGIDIPAANTLIIDRADLFGLANLYQLRGRVGRSSVQAYAYFTLPDTALDAPRMEKRLHIMETMGALGAGFSLASQDLDLRGAGNLLGKEQSGAIKDVGVPLYNRMLKEAIATIRQEDTEEYEPHVEIGISVCIPQQYVSSLPLRLSLYKRLSSCHTIEALGRMEEEMLDRFGPLVSPVKNLFAILHIKILCRHLGIDKVKAGPKGVRFSFFKGTCSYGDLLISYMQRGRILPVQDSNGFMWPYPWQAKAKDVDTLISFLQSFEL